HSMSPSRSPLFYLNHSAPPASSPLSLHAALPICEGGIDSLRSPCGQPAHCVHGLSNWLSPVVEPRSGLLIPPVCAIYEKKARTRSEEHTSELQSRFDLVCRLLLEKKIRLLAIAIR